MSRLFPSSLLMVMVTVVTGCGRDETTIPSIAIEAVELESFTESTLVLCHENEAELILDAKLAAHPDWVGHTWQFPLKTPDLNDGWVSAPYVCAVGPNGFYGSVAVGDSNGESIAVNVDLTYDQPENITPDTANSLKTELAIPLIDDGATELAGNWTIQWKWNTVVDKSGITK